MKRRVGFCVCVLTLCAFGVGAQADSVFVATLSGDSEAPLSGGSGHAIVDYNPTANDITFTLNFQNLGSDATMGHIHFGAPGTSGPPLLWFFPASLTPTPTAPSGSYSGTWTPADLSVQTQDPAITTFSELLSAMNAGDTYVNVHSVNFPNGEIRGQLVAVPEPASLFLLSLGLLLFGSAFALLRLRLGFRIRMLAAQHFLPPHGRN